MSVVVELPPLAAPVDQLWHVLLDLAEQLTVPWTLIGGQMVLLHAIEHGQVPPQISQDGDILADIRADARGIAQVVARLEALAFDLAGISADGLAHRYIRPAEPTEVVVDVLAPEGLGERADLTTSPPGRTLEVPGGTQALARTELVAVVHEGRRVEVPRPTLLGAIVAKATAVELADPARHYRDLALLSALVVDPFDMLDQVTNKDRQRLRRAKALSDDAHPAWSLVPEQVRAQGQIAFGVLLGG